MTQLLQLIHKNDGKWTWYQLDRALWGDELSKSGKLKDALGDLVARGLIRSEKVESMPNPVYFITEDGISYLENESSDTPTPG